NDWTDDSKRIPAAVVVRIKQPEIEHRVLVRDFENWLESAPRSPAEMALKTRLRVLLAPGRISCEIGVTPDLQMRNHRLENRQRGARKYEHRPKNTLRTTARWR